jgi:uncharacterized protein
MANATIDQQFIEFIVKSLVGNPNDVSIERRIDEKGVLLELTVNPEDLGRVIGKRGATAQSIRTLLRALGTKNDARYNLKIIDNGEERPARTYDDSSQDVPSSQKSEQVKDEEPVKVETPVVEDKPVDDETETENDNLAKTRKELDDLDDLDI